jgi:hypothetical protein
MNDVTLLSCSGLGSGGIIPLEVLYLQTQAVYKVQCTVFTLLCTAQHLEMV